MISKTLRIKFFYWVLLKGKLSGCIRHQAKVVHCNERRKQARRNKNETKTRKSRKSVASHRISHSSHLFVISPCLLMPPNELSINDRFSWFFTPSCHYFFASSIFSQLFKSPSLTNFNNYCSIRWINWN